MSRIILNPAASKVLFKKDVAPIVAVIGIACGWAVYKGVEHLSSPDVFLDPRRRSEHVGDGKYSFAEGTEWNKRVATNYRHKESPVSQLSIFEVFSSDYWKKRAEVGEAPESATLGGAAALKRGPMPALH